MIRFIYSLHFECNYRCPYCNLYKKWLKETSKKQTRVSNDEWFRIWDKIYEYYGSVEIYFSGGEPCIHPSFFDIAKYLSKKHYLGFTTNLSMDFDKFSKEILPCRVKLGINASFHPLYANFDTFIEKVLMLKNRGFNIWVSYVAYPPQMKLMEYYSNIFKENNLDFKVQVFRGEYNREKYPDSYTSEEKDLIKRVLSNNGDLEDVNSQISHIVTKEGSCYIDHSLAYILPNGRIKKIKESEGYIGNIFGEEFKLLDKPFFCPIGYYIFNDRDSDKEEYNFEINEYIKLSNDKNKSQEVKLKKTKDYDIKTKNYDKPCNFVFIVTNRCNLRCKHCDIWKDQNNIEQELSINQWKIIAKKIYNWVGKFNLVISGGEPFLKEGLLDLVSWCSELDIKVTISTNGSLLGSYLDKIVDVGLYNLAISLDSRLGISDWSRGTPGLTKVIMKNIDSLLKKERNFLIEIDTILMKQNLNEIIDMLNWTKSKGLVFNLNPLTETFGKKEHDKHWYKNSVLWPDYKKVVKVINELIDKKKGDYDKYICNPVSQLDAFKYYYNSPSNKPEGFNCSVGERNFNIGICGNVGFCPVAGELGNALKDSLEDIWFSSKAQQGRRKILNCKDRSCYILGCYFR